MAIKLDGKQLAREIQESMAQRVAGYDQSPGLLLIRVGEDPASVVYVGNKEKSSKKVGIASTVVALPEETSEVDLLARIAVANADPSIHGILVQLPLPKQIRAEVVVEAIDPAKDADGLHPVNQGRLSIGDPNIVSCTPLGILCLLRRYGLETRGKRAVILGRSAIVGRPMSLLLGQKAEWGDSTVTLCHSRSGDISEITRSADILVAAMGRQEAVRGDQVGEGSIVVDVGIHRIAHPEKPGKNKLVGDVHAPSVEPKVGYLSPVPGGVGPLTVTMLLANTLFCYETLRGQSPTPVEFCLSLVPTETPV